MDHEPDRSVGRSATKYLQRAAAAGIVFALFCVPAAARAVQPLVVHHAVSQVPVAPKACVPVRLHVCAPAAASRLAHVRPAFVPTRHFGPTDQVVPLEPEPSDGVGLRAPPLDSVL